MFTRRNFISSTAATASSPLSLHAATPARPRTPLRAEPSVRTLHARPADGAKLKLFSDGADTPPNLIRQEALERAFGSGTDLVLTQPDHWRMIEEGWFEGEDLYEVTDPDDPAMWTWLANYMPDTEAHDLLLDLFGERIDAPFGGYIADLGLEFGEHPSTPRYATAKLSDASFLPVLAAEVAARTKWLVIDQQPAVLEAPQ